MSFNERISVVIDIATDKASQALGGFRKSVNEAEGFTGKLKAGVGSLGSTFTSFISSPAGAATAVSAVGAAAFAAVDKFASLGLEVGKLSDATGLSTEEASRWTEVGGDLGLTADITAGLIEKMTQNLGKTPDKFKAMGIEVQHAADGTADMNATLLGAIDRLHQIQNPTARATAAAQLFGRGWSDAAELIAQGADSVKKKLGEVADVKVLSDSDVADAREFRDTMDQLKDAGEELALSLGKTLLPVITRIADGLGTIAGAVAPAVDGLGYMMDEVDSAFTSSKGLLEGVSGQFAEFGRHQRAIEEQAARSGLAASLEATKTSADHLALATEVAARNTRQYKDDADAAAAASDRYRNATEALALLLGQLDDDEALLNLQQQFDDLKTEAEADYAAVAAGSMTAEEATRNHELALIDLKKGVADYATEVLGLPAEQVSKIVAEMTDANADDIERRLTVLARTRMVNLVANVVTSGSSARVGDIGQYAVGTNSARPGLALVGERGPELVNFGGGESVMTADKTAAALSGAGATVTYNVTINGSNMTADETVRALKEWERRNGTGWRS